MDTRRITRLGALALCVLAISIAMPSTAHACRQDPDWCACIDKCQGGYWKCRDTHPDSQAMMCIYALDACQRACDDVVPAPDDPPVIDPTIVSRRAAPRTLLPTTTTGARLVADPVALLPNPKPPRPESVKCPQTQCIVVLDDPPEFDPNIDPDLWEVGWFGSHQECVSVQGSNTKCDSQWPGSLCTATISCDTLSY